MTRLDLSDSDVSNVALTIIADSCPLLRMIDLNAAKTNRAAVSSAGLYFYFLILPVMFMLLLFGFLIIDLCVVLAVLIVNTFCYFNDHQ